MHFCSTFDPQDSGYWADNPKDGRACTRKAENTPETGVWVSVDGGPQVDLFQPQYTSLTPPTTVHLPSDNAFRRPATDRNHLRMGVVRRSPQPRGRPPHLRHHG
jgi:hypothetical protein